MTTSSPPKQLSFAECDEVLCHDGSPFALEDIPAPRTGGTMKAWRHAPRTFRSYIAAQMHKWGSRTFISSPLPDAPGVGYDDREYLTYAETYVRALTLAGWLREQGVRMGTRVAIGGHNSAGWIVSYVAVHLLGAVPVLLNSQLQPDAQLHCLALTKPALVLGDAREAALLAPLAGALKDKGVGPIYAWSSLAHHPASVRAVCNELNPNPSQESIDAVISGVGLESLGPESDGMIFFTSGTTNMPKGVLTTQRGSLGHIINSQFVVARAVMRAGGDVGMATEMATADGPTQQVALLAIPLFHVTGCLSWFMRAFTIGSKLVFLRKWDVDDAIKVITKERCNYLGGVPAIANALFQSPRLPKDLPIEGISYGGAPPPKRLVGDIAKRWPAALTVTGWGMTETNAVHTAFVGQDFIDHPLACGVSMPVSETRIIDPETRAPAPNGTPGIILTRGANIMKGYVDNPKADAEAFDAEGWLDTGDIGYLDDEGFLYISDRAKDIIIRGGENIASAEVENGIYLDDRIAEAAAVSVPDPAMGEKVGLAVFLREGTTATSADIMKKVEPRLRMAARPVVVVICKEPLPRNANGKILKDQVKKIVRAQWAAQGGEEKARAKL